MSLSHSAEFFFEGLTSFGVSLCVRCSNMCNSPFQLFCHPVCTLRLQLCFQRHPEPSLPARCKKKAPLVLTIASNPVVAWPRAWLQPLFQPWLQTPSQTKKHRDVTLGVCKLGLEPWFTQSGTGGAKLHGGYSHSRTPSSRNAIVFSVSNNWTHFRALSRPAEDWLTKLSKFSTSRNGCKTSRNPRN